MVLRGILAVVAALLSGSNAQEFFEEVAEDFEARALSSHSSSSTQAPTTARVKVEASVSLVGFQYPADSTAATLIANTGLVTHLKTHIATAAGSGVAAGDVEITEITPTTRRQLSDDDAAEARRLAVGLDVKFTVEMPSANSAAAQSAITGGTFAAALKTAVEGGTAPTGFTTSSITATATYVGTTNVTTSSSSGASQVAPSGILSVFLVAIVALKF